MQTGTSHNPSKKQYFLLSFLAIIFFIVVAIWLRLTPTGLDGKLWAIAYSVCHQHPEHTLKIDGKLLPLCARCTGTFLGSLAGILFLSGRKERAGYPAVKIRYLLGSLVFFFAVDGINSGLYSLLAGESLYLPTNILRLVSGMGMGLTLAAILVPIWRQTMQSEVNLQPGLYSWRQAVQILTALALLSLLLVFPVPWLYYPVAVFSTLAVPILLTMVYTLLWILVLKKENTLRNSIHRITYITLGCLTAFIQIGLLDLLRYALTQSWTGFQF